MTTERTPSEGRNESVQGSEIITGTDIFKLRRPEHGSRLPAQKYDIPLDIRANLTENDRQVLSHLSNAGEGVAYLYQVQKANSFYPERMSQEEFDKGAKRDPNVLSEYTYVRRDPESGQLITKPFHEALGEYIKDTAIVASLKNAAVLSTNGKDRNLSFATYLRARASAFEQGNWDLGDILWMQMEDQPKIFTVIGPYDNYIDSRKRKFGMQGWIVFLNELATNKGQEFVNKVKAWYEDQEGKQLHKVTVRIDDPYMTFGQAYEKQWIGNNLPCQREMREMFGSVATIFNGPFEDQFRNVKLPMYRSVVDPRKRNYVPDEIAREADLKMYLGHETGHSTHPKGIGERLKEHGAWMKEFTAELFALQVVFALSQSRREKEAAFAMVFSNGLNEYLQHKKDRTRGDYYIPASIILNYFLESGSVEVVEGCLTWGDFERAQQVALDLYRLGRRIEREGRTGDAYNLVQRYYNESAHELLKPDEKKPQALFKRPPRSEFELEEIDSSAPIAS